MWWNSSNPSNVWSKIKALFIYFSINEIRNLPHCVINPAHANNSPLLAKQHTSPSFPSKVESCCHDQTDGLPHTHSEVCSLRQKQNPDTGSQHISCCKRERWTEYSVFTSVTVTVWKQYMLFWILINGINMECKCLHCCSQVVYLKAGQMPLKQKQSWVATRAQPGNAFRPCLPLRMLLKISLFDYGPFIIILFGKHNVICSHKNYRVAQQKTNNLLALCLNEQPCCLPVAIHFTILFVQYQTHIQKHSYNTGNTLQVHRYTQWYTQCRAKF